MWHGPTGVRQFGVAVESGIDPKQNLRLTVAMRSGLSAVEANLTN